MPNAPRGVLRPREGAGPKPRGSASGSAMGGEGLGAKRAAQGVVGLRRLAAPTCVGGLVFFKNGEPFFFVGFVETRFFGGLKRVEIQLENRSHFGGCTKKRHDTPMWVLQTKTGV